MHYRNTQVGWAVLAPLAVALVVVGLAAVSSAEGAFGAAVPLVILAFVALLFVSLTTEVDEQALRLRFGIGLVRRNIALADIASWERVRNPWYLGWGIRNYGRGLLYNVAGLDAVEVHLHNGSQLRVGTNDPDGLCAALSGRLGAPATPTDATRAVASRAQRRYVMASAFAVLAAFIGVGIMLFTQSRPITVTVDAQGFAVDDAAYDVRVPWSEVTSVELIDRVPHMSMRTNGLAMGGILRGYFRSPELGNGRLYVDTHKPPFVLLKTSGKSRFIVVNVADAGKTRALYEEAVGAWEKGR